jgi:hypothetical protein
VTAPSRRWDVATRTLTGRPQVVRRHCRSMWPQHRTILLRSIIQCLPINSSQPQLQPKHRVITSACRQSASLFGIAVRSAATLKWRCRYGGCIDDDAPSSRSERAVIRKDWRWTTYRWPADSGDRPRRACPRKSKPAHALPAAWWRFSLRRWYGRPRVADGPRNPGVPLQWLDTIGSFGEPDFMPTLGLTGVELQEFNRIKKGVPT